MKTQVSNDFKSARGLGSGESMLFSDNISILYVEDDETDIELLRRAMRKNNVQNRLYVAENGVEALRLLREPGTLRLKPCIILLDINMPKMNGLELLQIIRSHEEWRQLKCFIVTTSDEKVDRKAASALGVSGYITKPLKLNSPASMDAFNLMIDLLNLKSVE